MVQCPLCDRKVQDRYINEHLDSECKDFLEFDSTAPPPSSNVKNFFQTPATKRASIVLSKDGPSTPTTIVPPSTAPSLGQPFINGSKRPLDDANRDHDPAIENSTVSPRAKKQKPNYLAKAAPLADRMRPRTLDDVCGQELVGPNGVLRGLIEQDRVPSMVLWGGPGTGKTTIARLIAHTAGTRFVEINSTSSGVNDCKKIFAEARNELGLTGRKTILFCDELHRFSKSQQDVFLGPVEAGQITLIGATTENPSFKVVNALLSRCRTFTLSKLTDEDVTTILKRALVAENVSSSDLLDVGFLSYLAAFADGDARTALNLLELAIDLSSRPGITIQELKKSLTHTLVYDRAGDQHYDTISALHKSVRGSDPDASLYYLARMLQSGEDPLYIARRLIVIASEDVGLADNTMLSLATATYTACEKIGMPECRINLAHATVALALSSKSTRSYRGLANAYEALREAGVAGLSIPYHLRNAPTKLMKAMGYGEDYKYNPNYLGGRVAQEYLPEKLRGRKFLEDKDLGTEVDPDLPESIEPRPPDKAKNPLEIDGVVDAELLVADDEDGETLLAEGEEKIWTEEEELAAMSSQG